MSFPPLEFAWVRLFIEELLGFADCQTENETLWLVKIF